ncbi:hypothetical protein FGB62_71g220 [Gracilaria domingensis]|nr:hypothetical protein FGB62_71g220 [Gracilaria domingensis]
MRGLNLSRLAKASEGSFFKDQQATQAAKIRSTLSKHDISKLRSEQTDAIPTVDKLASISAQSAYKQLVKDSAHHAPQRISPSSSLLHRVQTSSSAAYQVQSSSSSKALDPTMMRALGSGKLNILADMKNTATPPRPLPGSEKYAEGAILGMASFSIATAMVASVGLVGGLYFYFNPSVVDGIRYRTRRFARAVDSSVGERIRYRVQRIKDSGPIVSDEKRGRVGKLMSGAVGMQTSQGTNSKDDKSDE